MRTVVTGLIAGLLAVICQASIITTDPGTGTTTTFTAINLTQGAGPFTINGFSVAGTNVAFGDAPYGLGGAAGNGNWVSFSFVAPNSSDTTITFDLGASYGLVGGFMNYTLPHISVSPTIEALAADGTTVLESDVLSALAPISTLNGLNQGAFRGITRSQNDIRFLRIGGDFLVTHSLEVGAAPAGGIPEPATVGLIFGGVALIFLARRKARA